MNVKEALKIMEEHQKWRLGGDGHPTDPKKLTEALSVAIEYLDKTTLQVTDTKQ